jgi:hypothetical protein
MPPSETRMTRRGEKGGPGSDVGADEMGILQLELVEHADREGGHPARG